MYGSYLTDGSHAAESTVDTEASVSDSDSLEASSSSATSDEEVASPQTPLMMHDDLHDSGTLHFVHTALILCEDA